ncbi:hypothetical protein PCH_Pc20g13200 [Penicillium rubens Wisconsin 54-1255]|uniref:Uncharacterized protein n=1 Tax=Penicillium rubens (strain ATCC 28089 / DSM 1075 / NRRL 1951 / Wisconsin 54-1255) TaxID=500485 RepID=B6HGQ7_PENRW|nr:hypothetical protein PCH_Pc20g13200 [Penicillium rubens Wisconsin 54-1255]
MAHLEPAILSAIANTLTPFAIILGAIITPWLARSTSAGLHEPHRSAVRRFLLGPRSNQDTAGALSTACDSPSATIRVGSDHPPPSPVGDRRPVWPDLNHHH